ncbi:MAG: SCO family protein [Alphaproteobacteria bacterium]|nr:SCO family protein [Alphaproteobacteria bacterium]
MGSLRFWRYGLWAFLVIVGCVSLVKYQLGKIPAAFVDSKPSHGHANIGGVFTLTDQYGNTRTNDEFRGKLMLVYFGYSYCPDICPLGLQNMSKAIDLLQKDRDQVVPIFITIDPKRDTVENLKLHASNFHPSFVMLTGPQDQIDGVSKAYRVYAATAPNDGTTDYLMDHSTMIYIMDRNGAFVQQFPHTVDPEVLAKVLQKCLFSPKP